MGDVDAGGDAIRVTLTATQGTLTMGSTSGLAFSAGDGADDVSMSFAGTITAINADLNGLSFKPTTDFSGTASLQVSVNDDGHNGAGGAKTASNASFIQVRSGGDFVFNTGLYGVNENGGTATITVLRGGTSGTSSVSYATSNGTATAGATCSSGVDYLPASGTFTWNNGDSSARQFTITICNDSLMEDTETINLTLSNPTGSGSLGPQSTAVLSIGTDDGPVLLWNEGTQDAIALDLVTQTRDPFSLTNPNNLSTDQRRRVSLFVWQVAPLTNDDLGSITATARDSQFRVYQLTVEAVSPVPAVPGVTQIVVRLPDNVVGAPRELLVKLTIRGLTTGEGFILIGAL